MAEIKKLEKNNTYLKVLWSDGEDFEAAERRRDDTEGH